MILTWKLSSAREKTREKLSPTNVVTFCALHLHLRARSWSHRRWTRLWREWICDVVWSRDSVKKSSCIHTRPQCSTCKAAKIELILQVQKRKKLVSDNQTKTGNWDCWEAFRPLRGFFSLRFTMRWAIRHAISVHALLLCTLPPTRLWQREDGRVHINVCLPLGCLAGGASSSASSSAPLWWRVGPIDESNEVLSLVVLLGCCCLRENFDSVHLPCFVRCLPAMSYCFC